MKISKASKWQTNRLVVINDLYLTNGNVKYVFETFRRHLFQMLRREANCFYRGDDDLRLTNLGNMIISLTTDRPIVTS